MKPNNTHDELLDVILKKAFTESSEKEIAEYEKEAENYAHITPTQQQKQKARRAFRAARTGKASDAGRIAASVVLALCLGIAAILAVPSARASLTDSFFQIYDTHITYRKRDSVVLRDITVQFIPEGYYYKPSATIELGHLCDYTFVNSEDKRISLFCASSDSPPKIAVDNEHHTQQEVAIPGATHAYAMVPENIEEFTVVIWETEKYIFMIDAPLPLQELLRMARSIVENEAPVP